MLLELLMSMRVQLHGLPRKHDGFRSLISLEEPERDFRYASQLNSAAR